MTSSGAAAEDRYAGIGTTELAKVAPTAAPQLTKISRAYRSAGWVLISGGAPGADAAFEHGAGDRSRIIRPEYSNYGITVRDPEIRSKAELIAATVCANHWNRLDEPARLLQTRNVYIILGEDLETPVKFVLAHPRMNARLEPKGGTLTGIVIAEHAGIPVYNLAVAGSLDKLRIDFPVSGLEGIELQTLRPPSKALSLF